MSLPLVPLLATDGSAEAPSEAEQRISSWAVAFHNRSGTISTFGRIMPVVDTTINCAELTAVLVTYLALDMAGLSAATLLTDHAEVVRRRSPSQRHGKPLLWQQLDIIQQRRPGFRLLWVPAHGRHRNMSVPNEHRILNSHADEAAGVLSARAHAQRKPWRDALTRRRWLSGQVLQYKFGVLRVYYDQLVHDRRHGS